MSLTEKIETAMKLHTEASDVEIASERFRCSQGLADIIASLDDHTDEQIGRMVREGFEAALSHEREQRRQVEEIRAWAEDPERWDQCD